MEHLNWSRLRTFRRCARQYHYKYIENLEKKKPKLQLIRGTILHEMLDAWVKKTAPTDVLSKYAKQYGALFAEEREEYGDLIGDCQKIFERYMRWHKSQDLTFIDSEVQIKVQLPGNLPPFVGTLDKIAVDSRKRRWLLDHKSHKNIPGEEARFSDLQTLLYVWGWNEQHPKERVTGVCWDYIRTKLPAVPEVLKSGKLSERANIDTDAETYLDAIEANKLDEADYKDILKDLNGRQEKFFKRVFLPNPPAEMIDQIVNEVVATGQMIVKLEDVYKVRSMTKDCSWCTFYGLCHAELRGHDANFVRKAEFQQRKPEVYDAEESEE